MLGKNKRSITAFSWGLVLAMAIYMVPGMTSDAIAKEAFASGRAVLDVAEEQSGLSRQELEKLLDPKGLTHP